jgi:rsbT co-antagonist protein RsbR
MADTGEGELIGPQSHQDDDAGWLDDKQLLPELVAHLREHRTQLRQEWVERIDQGHLLTAMTPQEVHSETTSVYDNYVEVLETGSVEALRSYARDLS